jgi:hypothetical protein
METCTSLAALHGYLSGDGCVVRNLPHQKSIYYRVELRNTEMTLLEDFQEKCEELFLHIPTISKDKDRCTAWSKELYYFFS